MDLNTHNTTKLATQLATIFNPRTVDFIANMICLSELPETALQAPQTVSQSSPIASFTQPSNCQRSFCLG